MCREDPSLFFRDLVGGDEKDGDGYKRPSHSVSAISPICQHPSVLGLNMAMHSHSGF